jgi:hypothetical protein
MNTLIDVVVDIDNDIFQISVPNGEAGLVVWASMPASKALVEISVLFVIHVRRRSRVQIIERHSNSVSHRLISSERIKSAFRRAQP